MAAELQHGHVPFLNVGVRLGLVVLQMEGPNWTGTRRQVNSEMPLERFSEERREITVVTTHFWRICRRGSRRAAATASP